MLNYNLSIPIMIAHHQVCHCYGINSIGAGRRIMGENKVVKKIVKKLIKKKNLITKK